MRDPAAYLADIVEAARNIERYAARGYEAFAGDELIQTWMVHHLQVIGEATAHVPDDLRARVPEVPWNQIVGMRHILVHGYFMVDAEVVWASVTADVPALRAAVERLIDELNGSGSCRSGRRNGWALPARKVECAPRRVASGPDGAPGSFVAAPHSAAPSGGRRPVRLSASPMGALGRSARSPTTLTPRV